MKQLAPLDCLNCFFSSFSLNCRHTLVGLLDNQLQTLSLTPAPNIRRQLLLELSSFFKHHCYSSFSIIESFDTFLCSVSNEFSMQSQSKTPWSSRDTPLATLVVPCNTPELEYKLSWFLFFSQVCLGLTCTSGYSYSTLLSSTALKLSSQKKYHRYPETRWSA